MKQTKTLAQVANDIENGNNLHEYYNNDGATIKTGSFESFGDFLSYYRQHYRPILEQVADGITPIGDNARLLRLLASDLLDIFKEDSDESEDGGDEDPTLTEAHEEQKREFGQAFDAEYYKPILEAIEGRKVFHFGIPADTVRIEVKRECEGYYRIRMKRDDAAFVETMSEYIDWETILNTNRAARLLSDLRADHTRAHRFKLGDMVRVSDREFGQTFGHVGRITKVYLINQLVGTRYTVEFVGELPKYKDGQPMKDNDFEPLDIEPAA